jgi:hypothetical protein
MLSHCSHRNITVTRKGRGTVTAIADLQRIIATNMDMDEYVAVASLDFSAAFDVVNVNLLMERLNTMGIDVLWNFRNEIFEIDLNRHLNEIFEI